MAHRWQVVLGTGMPPHALDLLSVHFRARCSRAQWWWSAEILVSYTVAPSLATQNLYWFNFLPQEIDAHRVDVPAGFLPSLQLVNAIETTWQIYVEIDQQLAEEKWLIDGMLAEIRDEVSRAICSRGG